MDDLKTTFEPPKCPCCGANLFRVFENVYETYTFNPKTGTYSREPADMDIRCPDCNCKLWDVFPEGACNYTPVKDHIQRISRNSPRFKNRAIIVSGGGETTRIAVPDEVILCDACNAEIQTEQVNLLVVDGGVWGAICEGCRQEHHSKLPIKEE